MSDQIVPGPSLTAVATPVDRFVAPLQKEVGEDPLIAVARSLTRVNPKLNSLLQSRHKDYVAEEEAKGQQAESYIDPTVALEKNRQGWRSLIDQQRKTDREQGTNHAEGLAASSPHFRRGLVKARAQRLGMALDDHLAAVYSRNPQVEIGGQMVNLHDVDDANAFSAWVQRETNTYADRFGIDDMDPVLAAEVFNPLAAQAWNNVTGSHSKLRLERYQQDYMDEMSANVGMILTGSVPVGEGYDAAGMNAKAVSAMEVLEQSVGHKLKVTSAYRSPEHNERVGGAKHSQHTHGKAFDVDVTGMSIEQRKELIMQARAAGFSGVGVYENSLHFDVGPERHWGPSYKAESTPAWAREALAAPVGERAVPAARLVASQLQVVIDDAVANGMNPLKANQQLVDTVLTAALDQRNPAVLAVLSEVSTGSGALGNIGWVKEKVRALRCRPRAPLGAILQGRKHPGMG
ncbi:YcbK family protein [Roseobacteraceae bacterium NS-SX3]